MLSNIIRPERKLEVTYGLRFFAYSDGGYEFPCDADGNVKLDNMTDVAIENYNECLKHPEEFPYAFKEIHKYSRWIKDEPYGTCDCGKRVYLFNQYMGACECPKCGKWYNLSGQELLPPEEWEVEGDDYDNYGWEDAI